MTTATQCPCGENLATPAPTCGWCEEERRSYVLTATQRDGNERYVSFWGRDYEAALHARDRRRKRSDPLRIHFRVIDLDDEERGAIEWDED